ncbi:SDR family NAD(P)-dependent oxidoreductase [Amycolatopsis sp.]|uniref:SDR family NAD(P)-dependent oxidoreductase n=1 Tax=Amycolatopsis sp. TaxID=37632 RepID=UPI002CB712F8|nr:SDR family NAD(P)-dependent oxidoreductase [Amycolatopsis sp.]HVV12248.1 SDR family NAD(P)-dependent oxidoreductase [Amycolatopsis sp.]
MRVAVVTGATQGLGFALAEELARQLDAGDVVYLTGRNPVRLKEIAEGLDPRIRTMLLDVSDSDSVDAAAATVRERHGGVDIVFGNAVMRIGPEDDMRELVDEYANVNNFGTTRVLRAFAPLLRDNGRLIVVASSLGTLSYVAPVLHTRFERPESLAEVDAEVAKWRDAVRDGSARGGAWPGFVNIPSKVFQVAAVRTLARQRREEDLARGILVAAVCPGMLNTPTSAAWWDVSDAATPAQAAGPLVRLVTEPVRPEQYGELIRDGQVLPWRPE